MGDLYVFPIREIWHVCMYIYICSVEAVPYLALLIMEVSQQVRLLYVS